MKTKLIKIKDGYELFTQGFLKGSTNHELIDSLNVEEGNIRYKLSLKNCQAIELGYELDELAEQEFPYDFDCPLFETLGITEKSHKSILIGMLQGTLQKGFQKAIELMGDNRFSEDDMLSFESFVSKWYDKAKNVEEFTALPSELLVKWKSLQQTEWGVEIETYCTYGNKCPSKGAYLKQHLCNVEPKLDTDGYLILKRI